jgi:phage shock protein A
MSNLPIDLTNQQGDKQAALQQKHLEWTQKVESLKRVKQKLLQRKATLQAMNKILQPRFGTFSVTNKNKNKVLLHLQQLEELSNENSLNETFGNDISLGVQKYQQVMNILKADMEECQKKNKDLEEVYDNVVKKTDEMKAKLQQFQQVQQQLHDQLEKLYVSSHSIDDLHLRFKELKDKPDEACVLMNVGATHSELYHGLLHLFEHWVCFESIVLNKDFVPEEADAAIVPSSFDHTIVIAATDIDSISKHDKRSSIIIGE